MLKPAEGIGRLQEPIHRLYIPNKTLKKVICCKKRCMLSNKPLIEYKKAANSLDRNMRQINNDNNSGKERRK